MSASRENVPVFNCVVHVAPPGADGGVVATVANLPGLVGHGRTEREALAQVVPQFQSTVARFHAAGEPIPWIDPPAVCPAGHAQRLIAVHL